jgi:hypothetical protein
MAQAVSYLLLADSLHRSPILAVSSVDIFSPQAMLIKQKGVVNKAQVF